VEVGELLEVLGLEVVRPQHPEVVLDQVGPLLLDLHRPGLPLVFGLGLIPVGRLALGRILNHLLDRLDRLRLDPGLRRVVDAAGKVAMSVDDPPRA
jgi:hypothetical protein